jgi:hypothetical protein
MPPEGQPVQKKTSIWVWIIGGIVVFLFAVTLTCGIVGYMGMRMIKHSGFDSELLKTNPAYAVAKMAITANGQYETVSSDDSKGTITVREKSTGKVMTMKFDPSTKKMVITTDDGKQASVTVDGNSFSAQSSDGGSVKFGSAAGNDVPSWVPVYPGSSPQGTMSSSNAEGSQNTFTFKSKDPASKIISYYTDQLKSAGFTISMTTTTEQGGLVQASDDGKKHTINVMVGSSAEGTETAITAVEKK